MCFASFLTISSPFPLATRLLLSTSLSPFISLHFLSPPLHLHRSPLSEAAGVSPTASLPLSRRSQRHGGTSLPEPLVVHLPRLPLSALPRRWSSTSRAYRCPPSRAAGRPPPAPTAVAVGRPSVRDRVGSVAATEDAAVNFRPSLRAAARPGAGQQTGSGAAGDAPTDMRGAACRAWRIF